MSIDVEGGVVTRSCVWTIIPKAEKRGLCYGERNQRLYKGPNHKGWFHET